MKVLFGVFVALFGMLSAYASTDYMCVSDCQVSGQSRGVCVRQCSDSGDRRVKSTDAFCMQSCLGQGYMISVCEARCED